MRTSFKAFVVVALISLGAVAQAGPNKAQRARFRAALEATAKISQAKPLECEEILGSGPEPTVPKYSLSISPSPSFRDGFMVHFSGAREFSTLVAYTGTKGHELGRLEVSSRDGDLTYVHRFFGYLEDKFIVDVRDGKPVMIQYFKTAPGGAELDMILCDVP